MFVPYGVQAVAPTLPSESWQASEQLSARKPQALFIPGPRGRAGPVNRLCRSGSGRKKSFFQILGPRRVGRLGQAES